MRQARLVLTALLLAAAPAAGQGTGPDGCYFGRCPGDAPTPTAPPPQGVAFVDRCTIGASTVRTTREGDVYGPRAADAPDGAVRYPGAAPACFIDIVSFVSGAVFCVERGSGLVFEGGPPPGGRPIGRCRPCADAACGP